MEFEGLLIALVEAGRVVRAETFDADDVATAQARLDALVRDAEQARPTPRARPHGGS